MPRFRAVPAAVLALLLALLAAAPAVAAPRETGRPASFDLAGLLAGLRGALTFLWAAEGCTIDPNGHCLPAPAAAGDNGCSIDPNGHCLPAPAAADEGCSIDPYGRCASVR